jgi:long-chain fatty acid transport protein
LADDFHYVNMIVGDRASGLGGAYGAVSDDPSGCYYNPAGIAFAPEMSLSASVNVFGTSEKTYKDVLTTVSGHKSDWEQESSSLLPNYFGIVRKLGPGRLGLSYAVPDSTDRRQKQYFKDIASSLPDNPVETYLIYINDDDREYLFGPSYALPLSDSLSIGATLYYYYRDAEIIRNQLLQFQQGEHILINYYETREDQGVRPILGLIWEPADTVAIGFSVSQTYIMDNDTHTTDIFRETLSDDPVVIDGQEYDFDDTDTVYFQSRGLDDEEDYPWSGTLSSAWFVSPNLLFTGDVTFHDSEKDIESVVNFALGCEYYFTSRLAWRCGVYTDFANTDSLSKGALNQDENIDIYGFNTSLTLFHKLSNITLGFSYGFGEGEAQMITDSPLIQDAEIENISVYLSAAYKY